MNSPKVIKKRIAFVIGIGIGIIIPMLLTIILTNKILSINLLEKFTSTQIVFYYLVTTGTASTLGILLGYSD